ncbi:MAG: hypothetical protein LH679_07135 [Cyanobacteria bacterium CAN_BIN43]|nr:hypothetical protein [Cyanobacteria bacterium CAN_BIN43]
MRTNHFLTSDIPLALTLSLVALFLSTSPALSQVTGNPAVSETVNETVNQNLNPLNSVINEGNTAVDIINGRIDNAPTEANGAVNRAIDSVLDQEAQNEIGGAIGTFQKASSLVSRVIGLGDRIRGILGSFNLDQILDAVNIDLAEITGNIYSEPGSKGAASDPLGDIEAGALGLPGIDEVDQAIAEEGGTALMESLAGKQEGGGMSGRVYLENLFRKNQAEQIADKTALSQTGQEKLASNAIAADDALKTSTAMMEDSEQQDVSQNVLRNISVQAHEQTVHTGLLALDAQLRARDDSVRNVLMGRTLMEIQAQRVSEQRRNASAFSGVITSGGLFYLPGLGDEQQAKIKPAD